MRLINTRTRQMEEFIGKNIPKYAVLSHTWEEEEVTFGDIMTNPDHNKKKGCSKIDMTCELALQDGLDYAWVDTLPELSEAINSMFRWYHRSAVCYAYLSDLEPSTQVEVGLHNCRWVRRGWTLQELIAPNSVELYNRDWDYIGSKSGERLAKLLSQITGIIIEILNHKARLSSISVAHRMAWAARRETTRIEDRAYSILGIFGVNMPMLYGEEEKAFRRLQEEIIKQAADLTIFAWNLPASTRPAHGEEMVCGILARSLDYFADREFRQSRTSVPHLSIRGHGLE
ncbi:HET domain containing protein [Rhypophila sp. PSN 637]